MTKCDQQVFDISNVENIEENNIDRVTATMKPPTLITFPLLEFEFQMDIGPGVKHFGLLAWRASNGDVAISQESRRIPLAHPRRYTYFTWYSLCDSVCQD